MTANTTIPPSSPTRTISTENLQNHVVTPPAPPHYNIVLTGGPCGGKTTALARLSSYLRERGFEVLTSPEAYSILVTNGMSPSQYYSSGIPGIATAIQNTVMDMQIAMEDGFRRVLLARQKPSVLLCDRGLMDGSVYMDPEEWQEMLDQRGVKSVCDIRDFRYNAVFHLVTAAEGAEAYYTLENNEVRTETPEFARVVDKKTVQAWVGHPNLHVFDNSTDFEGKLQRLVSAVAKLVGLPSDLRKEETKYLLKCVPDVDKFPDDIDVHVFDVEKVYLYDDIRRRSTMSFHGRAFNIPESDSDEETQEEEYSFIRKRTPQNSTGSVYGQTTVILSKSGQKIELKRILTQREYKSLYRNRDKQRHVIRQQRITFLYNLQSFNVHVYSRPAGGLCILHCQSNSKEGTVELPPFLEVERLLTADDEKRYGSFNISLIDKEEP